MVWCSVIASVKLLYSGGESRARGSCGALILGGCFEFSNCCRTVVQELPEVLQHCWKMCLYL